MKFIEFEKFERSTNYAMSELQCHDFYEIYFLLSGKRNIVFDNKFMPVEENTVVIIPPFFMHRTEGSSYKRINVYISSDLMNRFTDNSIIDNTVKGYKIQEKYTCLIHSLLNVATEIHSANIEADTDNKMAIFHTILYLLTISSLTPLELNNNEIPSFDHQIVNITEYINTHFCEKITIEMLCKQFFFTKSNLCRRFKQAMNCSITDYIYFVRISNAKHLLFTTDFSIEDIAFRCGFDSLNYFSLMFKKKVGVSPSKYRKTQ